MVCLEKFKRKGEKKVQVVLYRIDERLVHGQVMAVWLGKTGANNVTVVDEYEAKDAFMQQVYRLAAPANVTVDVVGVEDFRQRIGLNDGKKSIVLFKGPKQSHAALCEGVAPSELIIGNISNKPGSKKLTKFAYLTDKDRELLNELRAAGWRVSIQLLPTAEKSAF